MKILNVSFYNWRYNYSVKPLETADNHSRGFSPQSSTQVCELPVLLQCFHGNWLPVLCLPSHPGLPGTLPGFWTHCAVSAAERQRAPVDASERRASDLCPSPGSGLLSASSGFLSGGHRDTAPILAARGGIYWPEEPQIRHEAAVGDLRIGPASPGLYVPASPHWICPWIWDCKGQLHPVAVPCLWLS